MCSNTPLARMKMNSPSMNGNVAVYGVWMKEILAFGAANEVSPLLGTLGTRLYTDNLTSPGTHQRNRRGTPRCPEIQHPPAHEELSSRGQGFEESQVPLSLCVRR